jgi:hypothetical protein
MAIIINNDGDRIVSTLGDRDNLVKFDGMKVTVIDTAGDVNTGNTGKASYQWYAVTSTWLLVWKENSDNLQFVTESLLISSAGTVTASHVPQSGMVWGVTVQDQSNPLVPIIIADVNPTIFGNSLDIGSLDFTGKTLVFTYGYGLVQAAVTAILSGGGISSADLALKANQATTYTKAESDASIQAIVGAAPAAMNTLVEIAAQLASDETAAAALVNTVALKAPIASPTFTGAVSDTNTDGVVYKLRSVPQRTKNSAYALVAGDNGTNINITTGGITIPSNVFVAGDIISIYNQSGSTQAISWTGGTMYLMGTTTPKTSLSLAGRGGLTIMFVTGGSSPEMVVSGNV